jgi:hypothetical protein
MFAGGSLAVADRASQGATAEVRFGLAALIRYLPRLCRKGQKRIMMVVSPRVISRHQRRQKLAGRK